MQAGGTTSGGQEWPQHEYNDVLVVMGSDVGRDRISAVILQKVAPNQEVLLSSVGMLGLPFHLRCAAVVWKLLDADTSLAKRCGRTPFTYTDITCKHVNLTWLPADAVGGSSLYGYGVAVDSSDTGGTFSQLGETPDRSYVAASRLSDVRALDCFFHEVRDVGDCFRPVVLDHVCCLRGADLGAQKAMSK